MIRRFENGKCSTIRLQYIYTFIHSKSRFQGNTPAWNRHQRKGPENEITAPTCHDVTCMFLWRHWEIDTTITVTLSELPFRIASLAILLHAVLNLPDRRSVGGSSDSVVEKTKVMSQDKVKTLDSGKKMK